VRRRRDRLWPASREVHPKQFLLCSGAFDVSGYAGAGIRSALFERPIVITNAAYRFMVLEQLAEIGLEATSCWNRCA